MKTINTLCVLLLTGAMMTGCSKDDAIESTTAPEAAKTYFLSVNASKGSDDNTTRALTLNGKKLEATWATTEHVYVMEGTTLLGGSLSPDRAGSNARLNGEITGLTGSLPQDLTLLFPRSTWSYTGQIGTLPDIAAKFDYATATANVDQIDGSHITATSDVTFSNEQAIVKFILQNGSGTAISASSLRISSSGLKTGKEDTGDITITPTSATSEIHAALRGISGKALTLTATVGGDIYVYQKTSATTFTHGKYYAITVKMHQVAYPVALSAVTTDYIGSVVGANGNVYPTAAAATAASTSAVAMIAYVSGTGHGLAIALNDESGIMGQDAAITAASGHAAVTGATWKLPTLVDWTYMLTGCTDFIGLNSKLGSASGTAVEADYYWSQDVVDDDEGYCVDLHGDPVSSQQYKTAPQRVRACLSF